MLSNEPEMNISDLIATHNESYYSASALLAVQSAVIARPFLSVCLSRSGIVSR